MARAARRVATRSGGEIVVVNASAPVARRSRSVRRRSSGGGKRRRRSSGGSVGGSGGNIQKRLQSVALGGLAYGLLIKHFPSLPRIPGIGRSGTVALACISRNPRAVCFRISASLLQRLPVPASAKRALCQATAKTSSPTRPKAFQRGALQQRNGPALFRAALPLQSTRKGETHAAF